ncbi:hypothetical protein [Mycobacterium sp.]|uniref:hypothetical protein n=1 Tax=Mycobacterium sp. TaxID=1785 RepID=UPI0025F18B7C|nr:hypothetical protein [Mycobacterium sp.]
MSDQQRSRDDVVRSIDGATPLVLDEGIDRQRCCQSAGVINDLLCVDLDGPACQALMRSTNPSTAASGVSRHWSTAWRATRPRGDLGEDVLGAVAVHTNGLGAIIADQARMRRDLQPVGDA